jgi:hypothetical protein
MITGGGGCLHAGNDVTTQPQQPTSDDSSTALVYEISVNRRRRRNENAPLIYLYLGDQAMQIAVHSYLRFTGSRSRQRETRSSMQAGILHTACGVQDAIKQQEIRFPGRSVGSSTLYFCVESLSRSVSLTSPPPTEASAATARILHRMKSGSHSPTSETILAHSGSRACNSYR